MTRPGRNDACICGSGRKYKHCCLAKEGAAAPATDLPTGASDGAVAGHLRRAQQLHEAGRNTDAEMRYQQVLAARPGHPAALHLLGLLAHQAGRHGAAVELIMQSLQAEPANAQAHNNIGNALHRLGEIDQAIASYEVALLLQPDFVEAHNNLALMLKTRGRFAEAAESYRRALAIDPSVAQTHFHLALALHRLGRRDEAIPHYRRTLALQPQHADALSNLGAALRDLGRLAEATACFRQAVALQPRHANALNNLGQALADAGRIDEAVASFRQVLQHEPQHGDAWNNLGAALLDDGELAEAARCWERAEALGIAGARVRRALMLPPIMGTREEMLAARAAYERGMDELLASPLRIDDPLQQVGMTPFYVAYHGLDDRELQMKLARVHLHLCPSLAPTAAHCARPRADGARRKVGFLSKYLFNHSISKCFSRIVTDLARHDGFEVCLISTAAVDDAESLRQYAGFSGTRVRLPPDLAAARETIAALELDVLLYLDVGMDPQSYFLAFARLARVQGVIGGHPVTTGLPQIDWFLTADVMEPPGAEAHYSERLARTPTGVFYFERPVLPARLKTRAELGLPEGRHIYLCPMKLHKIHPDFDAAVDRLLHADPEGVVVFSEDDTYPSRRRQLSARFERTLGDAVRARSLFIPWIRDYADFISLNAAADVVLDPFHFGVGSTLIATLAVRTPIVTLPGEFMRGRVGLGFCRMLDLPECVAESSDDYVERAIRLATDPALRASVKAKIAANDTQIYDNPQPVRQLAAWLDTLSMG